MLAPLAHRLRPTKLADIIGQKHLVGEGGFLYEALQNHLLVSIIFFGPPGSGKTTIAEAFAKEMNVHYKKLNAVTSTKKDIELAIDEAKLYPEAILIVDEVHRLNKDKQDLLLPYIEEGTIFLLGMTTANPYIAINPAIRSRCHLLEVKPLSREDIVIGINRALSSFNGLDNHISMDDDAKKLLATLAGGDLRFAYNYLEVLSLSKNQNISMDDIKSVIRVPNYLMDQNEEEHYDSVSALQKSIRGSDVDAALYYLARLCAANDLESIERRLLVTAYEDIGLANPQAVERCAIALESARKVGFPEAVIPLGFTVCDLALSPKSKAAATSIQSAMDYAKDHQLNVLDYLKLTPDNAQEIDKYPYDRPDLWEKMQYLPELIKEMQFYQESDASQYEKVLNANYHRLKKNARTSNLAFLKSKKPRE